ncbi:MAG TPA: N-acetyltransferase [Gammaproteobacteria bacterium]|nr:N-acetyltransferase [Gammaproteobacteria bacterium]
MHQHSQPEDIVADIRVRAEKPGDMQAIDVVNISAFEGDAEAQLVSDLRNSPGYIPELSLVAEYRNRLVGHAMLTRISLLRDNKSLDMLVLGPMSVVPSQAYRGIGAILLQHAITKAEKMGFGAIAEVGQTEYYRRHGFRSPTDFGLIHNLQGCDGAITAMELRQGTLQGGGKLIFPDSFKVVCENAA